MFRLIIFLLLVLALGFGFAWFADRPGMVSLVWEGTRYETSLMVALAAFVAVVVAIMVTWWIVSIVLRSPLLMRRFFRNRRRDRGYHALSQGLLAAGTGDAGRARKLARDSRKLLGSEPLVELLDVQTMMLEGDRKAARDKFETMLNDDDTKLVALRGLYLEAEREGAREAARHYAQEASSISAALPWAGNANLKYQAAEGDWEGALRTLESMRSSGLVKKDEAARQRAVLLTAQAMTEEPSAPERAAKLARQAHDLAPDLVPAAVIAARALTRINDLKRAARILEATWKKQPHPEIAEAYVNLRAGDSVSDRLKRAQRLVQLQPDHVDASLALAEAAIHANQWRIARDAMKPVLESGPTQRACLLMADIEEGENNDLGRMRDWLSRAVRAPRDPAWTADGHVAQHWLPVSPVTGRLDAFEWKAPVGLIGMAPDLDIDGVGMHHDTETHLAPKAVDPDPAKDAEDAVEVVEEPNSVVITQDEREAGHARQDTEKPSDTTTEANSKSDQPLERNVGEPEKADEKPVVLARPPDDPGVDPEEPEEKQGFRLF
ncbi:MAG: heme biosynthesis protein HemY [Nitratireductor sp.]|nr:heme biosynthesis protein HemY [Nitratireductor sp.]